MKVSPGAMPWNVKPGTPSIGLGRMMPCQWIEVGSERRLVTRKVTVSPSRQRRIGAGTWPLTATAMRGCPVILMGSSPIVRLNTVPLSTGAGLLAARPRSGHGKATAAPAVARPCTKRRRLTSGRSSARPRRLDRLDHIHAVRALSRSRNSPAIRAEWLAD